MADYEKQTLPVEKTSVNSYDQEENFTSDAEVQTTQLNFIDRIAHKLNAETKGIELVSDEEKTDTSF